MIKSAVARTPILVFILTFFALGYTIAHNKVVVVPLGADAGVSGYEIVLNQLSINPTETITAGVTASCPSGKKAIGGGGLVGSKLRMVDSYPFINGSDWRVNWARRSGAANTPATATVRVICANTIN